MVRSWDQRLKGADVKKVSGSGLGLQGVPVVHKDGEATIERRRRKPEPEQAPSEASAPVATQPPTRPTRPGVRATDEGDTNPANSLFGALEAAVSAAELAALVADRETGNVLWASPAWTSRFGEHDDFARHLPSESELGQAPLPSAGEEWQRTRSMLLADGSEDLCNLVFVGTEGPDATELVSVVATNGPVTTAVITSRDEVITVIDGSIAASSSGRVGVIYIDLDRFRIITDRVGDFGANQLLEQVTRKLGGNVRGTDLVFRMPTDEFVIVACEMEDEHIAEDLAETVRAAIASVSEPEQSLALTASIGVAVLREDQTGDTLLSAAEAAVFEAKTKGRNRVAVHDSEARTRKERQKIAERQLREAIDRRQIQFNYQPVVEMSTGRVVGAEALLRFGGDVKLSAAEVVAAAEVGGLMGTLGITVVDGVTRELGEWLKEPDREQVVMINLSASQLEDPKLAARLAVVASEGYPDRRMALEVPEVVVRSHRKAYLALNRRLAGTFLMGIDGFGTNESSVDMLTGLPLDYIKLHRSVTAGIVGKDDNMAGLMALLGRAEQSGIMVVALGVESRTQAEQLQDVNCPLGQGFLYASAVTAEKLMDLANVGFTPAKAGN